MPMKNVVTGVYTYAEFTVCLVSFLPIMAVQSALHRDDPTQRVPGQWMRRLGRTSSKLTPLWKFHVEGQRPADIDTKPYVVVANHESLADPFLLCSLPWDMRWVAKEELFRPPVVGWAMKWGGDIPLRRGNGDSIRMTMNECERSIAGGISVMMFPEGTRSQDGTLLPFKDGAFKLAVKMQVPVLPLALAGTRDMRPKGSKWFGKANACVKVLEPIPTAGLGEGDVATLREQTRDRISAALPDLRARYGFTQSS